MSRTSLADEVEVKESLNDIPVVKKFPETFSEEISKLP